MLCSLAQNHGAGRAVRQTYTTMIRQISEYYKLLEELRMINIKKTNLEFDAMARQSTINRIVIYHVSDLLRDVSEEEIHGWHKVQGWSGIGYHYVIRRDGTIERGGQSCKSGKVR